MRSGASVFAISRPVAAQSTSNWRRSDSVRMSTDPMRCSGAEAIAASIRVRDTASRSISSWL
jgi:hypothetical protein